jgi:hypothetical protein
MPPPSVPPTTEIQALDTSPTISEVVTATRPGLQTSGSAKAREIVQQYTQTTFETLHLATPSRSSAPTTRHIDWIHGPVDQSTTTQSPYPPSQPPSPQPEQYTLDSSPPPEPRHRTPIGSSRGDTTKTVSQAGGSQPVLNEACKPNEPDVEDEEDKTIEYKLHIDIHIAKAAKGTTDVSLLVEVKRSSVGLFSRALLDSISNLVQQKAMAWSMEHNQPLVLLNIIAVPLHEKSKKHGNLRFPVVDSVSWVYVDEKLEAYEKSGKKEPHVTLTYNYSRVQQTQASQARSSTSVPPSSQQLGGRDFSHSQPRRGIPTTVQLQEMEEEHTVHPNQANTEALATKWTCTSGSCENASKICWYDSSDPSKHYPLNSSQILTWRAMVEKDTSGRLTIDTPPESIRSQLEKASKSAQKKKKGEASHQAANTATSILTPASRAENIHVHVYNHSSSNNSKEVEDWDIQRLRDELKLREDRLKSTPSSRHSTTPYPQEALRSSPVALTRASQVEDYIEWLKLERPKFAHLFDEALKVLLDEGMSLDILQKMKRLEDWTALGIAKGVGVQIAENIKAWERATSEHTSTLSATSRCPPSYNLPVR